MVGKSPYPSQEYRPQQPGGGYGGGGGGDIEGRYRGEIPDKAKELF